VVIDSSALIALIRDEPGAEVVQRQIERSVLVLSSVNFTEIKGKLVGNGLYTPQSVDEAINAFGRALEIVSFDLEQSNLAAFWYSRRSAYNLSLGDCACLALAEAKGVPCLTAERAWAKLPNLRVKLELIR
jgi:PIN domain nuclease of toxin-antitoxin system